MTQAKITDHSYYGACVKCAQPTSNRTGLCGPCRTQICTKCIKPFVPKKPSKVCGYCRSHQKRRGEA